MVLTRPRCASFLDAILSPMAAIDACFGADEDDALVLDSACANSCVLGQEAVARMDRLGAGLLAGRDDLVDQQVGLRRRRRADAAPPRRPARTCSASRVGLGIDRDGLDAQPLAAVLMTRQAISPRLAIRIFLNMCRVSARSLRSCACQAIHSPRPFPGRPDSRSDLLEHGLAFTAGCCRACATGSRASCRAASPASGRCAGASRAA